MNVFVAIMLIFAAIGFVDKALEGRWGLSEQFDRGLYTMGAMVIPIVAMLTVAVTLAGSIPAIRMLLRLRPAEVLHGR